MYVVSEMGKCRQLRVTVQIPRRVLRQCLRLALYLLGYPVSFMFEDMKR